MLIEDKTMRTEHSSVWRKPDGSLAYVVRGAEMFYDSGVEAMRPCNFAVTPATAEDAGKCRLKYSNCHNKTGISDGANGEHILGYKVNGHQLKMSPRKLTLWNGFNNSHVDLFDANISGFNAQTGEFENYYPGINLKYCREAGQMGQSLVVNFPSAFQHHYALGEDPAWELAYWTEIEHPDTLAFLFQNGVYSDAPDETIKSGTWDETRDLDVDSFLIYRRYWEKGRDLLYFPQQTIREAETQPSMDKPGKIVIVKEAIREKMRLVKRDGKTYLVESVPMSFVRDWNFVESPLPLNYTTLSGGLAADTSYTTETVLIDAAVTLGTYNLTISGTAVIKNNNGAKYIQVNSTGTLIITGTAARKVYLTSANDDTVGEAIAGSTGVPSTADVRAHIYITSTSSTITANYATLRYSGAAVANAHVTFGVNSAQMPTFNDCQFEWGGPLGTIGRASTYTGTAVTLTRCNFINPGNYCAQADNVYVTHMKVYGAVFNIITVLNGTDSYIRNFFGQGAANANMIVLAAGVLTVTNFESYGKNGSASTGAIVATGGTLTLKYSIIMGNRNGVWANGGTINHTYNLVHGNTANFVGTVQDATESIANPEYVWPVNSCVPALRTGSWGLTQTTTDKVNDAGYEYLVGTYKDENKTLLVATDNIPLGFCDWENMVPPAVEIDLWLKKNGVKSVQYSLGDQVTVDGRIKTSVAVNSVSIAVEMRRLSDDALQQIVFSGAYSFAADTYVSLADIVGQPLEFTVNATGEFYAKISVSGGTPEVFTSDSFCCFQVTSADSSAPSAPFLVYVRDKGVGGALDGNVLPPEDSDYERTEVFYSGSDGKMTELGATLTGEQTSFSIVNLQNGRTYFLQAFSYDNAGNISRGSNVVMAIPTADGSCALQSLYEALYADLNAVEGLSAVRQGATPPSSRETIFACLVPNARSAERIDSASEVAAYSFELTLFTREKIFVERVSAAALVLDRIRRLLQTKQYAGVAGHFDTAVETTRVKFEHVWPNCTTLQTGLKIVCLVNETI